MASRYWTEMKTDIAARLRQDHANIRAGLTEALKEGGAIADAARRLSELCLPHFELEERIVLPVLERLNDLASREEERVEIAQLHEQIAELNRQHNQFAAEHRSITSAVDTLREAANRQGRASADPPARVARLGYINGAVSFSPAGEND